jgi:outer membrane protein insertion porin family
MRLFASVFVLLMAFAAFPVFSQQPDDWYQGKPITDIRFSPLKNVKDSDLDAIVKSYRGSVFTDDLFLELQGKLYALEFFDELSPRAVPSDDMRTGVIIYFTVKERPVIYRINFLGNRSIRSRELLEAVSLKPNDFSTQVKVRLDEQAIIRKYVEKGFPDAGVRSEEVRGSDDGTITLNFYVTEGEKITIQGFFFEGNSAISRGALLGELSLKKKTLFNDGAFQEAKLLADRTALAQYYHDRGYIDAEISDVIRTVEKDEKGNNNMVITFQIFEGRQYTFGGISFEGNRIFSTEQLTALVTSKTGETVNARRLAADFQRVMDLYYENGYINNTINQEENRDQVNGVISFHFSIVERGRAYIENIIIRGNEKTDTSVILREIPLEPGDVFSRTKVVDGLRNLYNLQYFSNVLADNPPGSEDNLMDLIITVEEQPTMDIQFGMTFSGNTDPEALPVSILAKWSDRNFLGRGNILGAEVNAATDTVSASLEYTQRWIFGLPLSGGFDLTGQWSRRNAAMENSLIHFNGDELYAFPEGFSSYSEYNDRSRLPPNEFLIKYDQWYMSLGFSTGYRWGTFLGNLSLRGGVRTGFIRNNYNDEIYTPFDPTLRDRNNSWTPQNSFWTSLSLDQRDISYDPSSGYYGIQRFGFYGIFPPEREHYFRSDTKAEYFYTLLNIPVTDNWNFKMIFGIHSGVSLITKSRAQDETPPIEDANKLSVDGMFVGRGWTGEYRNRGLALWENWAELRFPIVAGVLAWDFFLDAAGVKDTAQLFFTDFRIDDMRFSLGGGLRITLPQFPFRFSFLKRFRVQDGQTVWERGSIGAGDKPESGIDFSISFSISTY